MYPNTNPNTIYLTLYDIVLYCCFAGSIQLDFDIVSSNATEAIPVVSAVSNIKQAIRNGYLKFSSGGITLTIDNTSFRLFTVPNGELYNKLF